MIEPINEPTEVEVRAILETVASYIELRVLSDPRYCADMTEREIVELAEAILHEDTPAVADLDKRVGVVIAAHRVGLVPGLLAQQERDRG